VGCCALLAGMSAHAEEPAESSRGDTTISAVRLVVSDLPATQGFYEKLLGLTEVERRERDGQLAEVRLGFASGARLVLTAPSETLEAPLTKSQYPVVLLRVPDLDSVSERLETAGHRVRRLGGGALRVAITRDPSGNAVEILAGPGATPVVGGSKLSVRSREAAEGFFGRVFGVSPLQRYKLPGFDEVLLGFGTGPFLALFEATTDADLTRSRFAATTFVSSDLDGVAERLRAEGASVEWVESGPTGSRQVISRDPSGNVIEVLER
jgi:catechol 2,3-dioxygenase-like lactoylglutathione lyase family enzyme